jgi:molybdenum cofactor cytidylyltransferase
MNGARAPALAILAAGASTRLGTCKALVELGGVTVLERLARAGACFDAAPVLVVSGADHAAIARALPAGAELAWNARWSAGRAQSVRCARDARPGCDLCLAPVDVPLVPASVFVALQASWLAHRLPARGWLAPCTRATEGFSYGHPVLVGRGLLAELDLFAADAPLSLLRACADPLLAVEVESLAIHEDLDTPSDLERLARRTRI